MKNPYPNVITMHDKKGAEKMQTKIKVVTPTMKANDDLFYKMQVEFEETMNTGVLTSID